MISVEINIIIGLSKIYNKWFLFYLICEQMPSSISRQFFATLMTERTVLSAPSTRVRALSISSCMGDGPHILLKNLLLCCQRCTIPESDRLLSIPKVELQYRLIGLFEHGKRTEDLVAYNCESCLQIETDEIYWLENGFSYLLICAAIE